MAQTDDHNGGSAIRFRRKLNLKNPSPKNFNKVNLKPVHHKSTRTIGNEGATGAHQQKAAMESLLERRQMKLQQAVVELNQNEANTYAWLSKN